MKTLRPWIFFALLCLMSLLTAVWLRGGTDASPFAVMQSLVADIGNWFTDRPETQDTALPSLQHNSPTTTPPTAGHQPQMSSVDHTAEDRQVCSRPRTKSRTDTDTKLIYKWVDDEGQTHMSDKQPKGIIASVMDIGMDKQDFTYKIIPDGISLPVNFPGQVSAGSKRIYDTWHFFLGERKLRQSQIELLVIGGPDRFNAYHAKVSPDSNPVNGFYSMRKNQAVVKYDPANIARALRTTFHEISHLITASHLGPTPPWLTEGLAEYFETMQVRGQTGAIHPNHAHIKLLQRTPLPRLEEYLAIDRPQWHGAERDRNYAIAWSLMHFLLQGAPGMYALQDVIQQAEANFCRPFSAVQALNDAYPGGIDRLDTDWRQWLASRRPSIQQT